MFKRWMQGVYRFPGVVVITSASHAEGLGFDPRGNLFLFFAVDSWFLFFFCFYYPHSTVTVEKIMILSERKVERCTFVLSRCTCPRPTWRTMAFVSLMAHNLRLM